MKNAIQEGNVLTLVAPYDVLSGAGVQVGSIFGVAAYDALQTEEIEVSVVEVFEINKKTTDVVTQGLDLYWDDTNKEVTVTASTNLKIGQAILPATSTDTTVQVRLNS